MDAGFENDVSACPDGRITAPEGREALIAELEERGYDTLPGVKADWPDWRDKLSDTQLRVIVENIRGAAADDNSTAAPEADNDAPSSAEFPDISEMVDGLREIVAAGNETWPDGTFRDPLRFGRALDRCQKLIADADAAMDANFGEAS